MKRNETRPSEEQGNHLLSDIKEGDIRRCDFSGLILEEELMIKGVGQILDEFGCSPHGDDLGDDAEIEIPALALWMLGRVVTHFTEQLLRKLDIAADRLKSAGVPEVLKARLSMKGDDASTPVSGRSGRTANGAGKQPVAAAAAQARG
jgi:hypothetical protein